MKSWPVIPKRFLFLQGPHGPFFARLAAALRAEGHSVDRVNFNGGDRHDWPGEAIDYRGSARDWPLFLDMLLGKRGITDLLFFGDCRPLHSAAHGMARLRGVRTHVFEEGYLRPDWVTLERDGVNGNSSLPGDPEWYRRTAAALPPLPTHASVPSSVDLRTRAAWDYYLASTLAQPRFRRYRSHRPLAPVVEGLGWVRRLAVERSWRRRSDAALSGLAAAPYFVFPLQLDSDHQVRTHSPFGSMAVAISFVLESFARAAPPGTLLAIKRHPLDYSLTNWRRVVEQAASRHGVADRVLFLEEADIAPMVAGASGVVTVNSTTGTLALRAGVPVAVLGHAVYHVAGITHQGRLDAFWGDPQPPDPATYDAFCRVLLDRCLVHGSFLGDRGIDLLVEGSVRRLTDDIGERRATPDAVPDAGTAGRG